MIQNILGSCPKVVLPANGTVVPISFTYEYIPNAAYNMVNYYRSSTYSLSV